MPKRALTSSTRRCLAALADVRVAEEDAVMHGHVESWLAGAEGAAAPNCELLVAWLRHEMEQLQLDVEAPSRVYNAFRAVADSQDVFAAARANLDAALGAMPGSSRVLTTLALMFADVQRKG
eukprot:g2596.t1